MRIEIMTGKSFSLNEKCSFLEASDKLPKTSQRDAAAKLGVPQATLCSRHKQRETVMAASDGDRNECARGKHLWLKPPSSGGLIMPGHVMPPK